MSCVSSDVCPYNPLLKCSKYVYSTRNANSHTHTLSHRGRNQAMYGNTHQIPMYGIPMDTVFPRGYDITMNIQSIKFFYIFIDSVRPPGALENLTTAWSREVPLRFSNDVLTNGVHHLYPPVIQHISVITVEHHHVQWENSLFQWPFSIANCLFTRGYHSIPNPIKPAFSYGFPMVFHFLEIFPSTSFFRTFDAC